MDANGSALTRLTFGFFDNSPSWSPDGQRIAFASSRDRQAPEIYVMNADGSALTRLTDDFAADFSPAWSPDGRLIAFSSNRDDEFNTDIYQMSADGSAPTRLTNHPSRNDQPSWSPNGQRIAFTSSRDGNQEIYVMNADGSAPTRLTNHPANDFFPSWSPDGRQIAFTSSRDGNEEIYVMGADGSVPTRLTNHPASDIDPSWSGSGLIAFSSERDGNFEIYVMRGDGSAQTRLTNNPAADRSPSWWPWLDVTPPEFVGLVDISRPAVRWFGSVIGFGLFARDDLDPDPEVTCTPPGGSLFPIGTTQVDCTATDNVGNTASGSFRVTIRGPYEELGAIAGTLRDLIAGNVRDRRGTARLGDALSKVEAAREEFARTPPGRPAALGHLLGVIDNFAAAVTEGELSPFGFSILAPQVTHVARLAADQSIAEAEARGGNAAAIAEAQDALAKGDAKRAAGEFSDAVAQYRKACSIGLTA